MEEEAFEAKGWVHAGHRLTGWQKQIQLSCGEATRELNQIVDEAAPLLELMKEGPGVSDLLHTQKRVP